MSVERRRGRETTNSRRKHASSLSSGSDEDCGHERGKHVLVAVRKEASGLVSRVREQKTENAHHVDDLGHFVVGLRNRLLQNSAKNNMSEITNEGTTGGREGERVACKRGQRLPCPRQRNRVPQKNHCTRQESAPVLRHSCLPYQAYLERDDGHGEHGEHEEREGILPSNESERTTMVSQQLEYERCFRDVPRVEISGDRGKENESASRSHERPGCAVRRATPTQHRES